MSQLSISDLKDRLKLVKENLPYLEERLPMSIVQGYIRELEERIDSLLANANLVKEKVEDEGNNPHSDQSLERPSYRLDESKT